MKRAYYFLIFALLGLIACETEPQETTQGTLYLYADNTEIYANGERCVKGEGDILGMNCQFKAYDAANGRIGLNANLYNERGGVALYYSGSFTLVE